MLHYDEYFWFIETTAGRIISVILIAAIIGLAIWDKKKTVID